MEEHKNDWKQSDVQKPDTFTPPKWVWWLICLFIVGVSIAAVVLDYQKQGYWTNSQIILMALTGTILFTVFRPLLFGNPTEKK